MKSKEVNSEEIEEINNKIKQKLNRAVQSDRDLGELDLEKAKDIFDIINLKQIKECLTSIEGYYLNSLIYISNTFCENLIQMDKPYILTTRLKATYRASTSIEYMQDIKNGAHGSKLVKQITHSPRKEDIEIISICLLDYLPHLNLMIEAITERARGEQAKIQGILNRTQSEVDQKIQENEKRKLNNMITKLGIFCNNLIVLNLKFMNVGTLKQNQLFCEHNLLQISQGVLQVSQTTTYPYSFCLLSNCLSQSFMKLGEHEQAMGICTSAIKRSTKWIKENGPEMQTNPNKSVIMSAKEQALALENKRKRMTLSKVLCILLVTRAKIFGLYGDQESRKEKCLKQAMEVAKVYCSEDFGLIKTLRTLIRGIQNKKRGIYQGMRSSSKKRRNKKRSKSDAMTRSKRNYPSRNQKRQSPAVNKRNSFRINNDYQRDRHYKPPKNDLSMRRRSRSRVKSREFEGKRRSHSRGVVLRTHDNPYVQPHQEEFIEEEFLPEPGPSERYQNGRNASRQSKRSSNGFIIRNNQNVNYHHQGAHQRPLFQQQYDQKIPVNHQNSIPITRDSPNADQFNTPIDNHLQNLPDDNNPPLSPFMTSSFISHQFKMGANQHSPSPNRPTDNNYLNMSATQAIMIHQNLQHLQLLTKSLQDELKLIKDLKRQNSKEMQERIQSQKEDSRDYESELLKKMGEIQKEQSELKLTKIKIKQKLDDIENRLNNPPSNYEESESKTLSHSAYNSRRSFNSHQLGTKGTKFIQTPSMQTSEFQSSNRQESNENPMKEQYVKMQTLGGNLRNRKQPTPNDGKGSELNCVVMSVDQVTTSFYKYLILAMKKAQKMKIRKEYAELADESSNISPIPYKGTQICHRCRVNGKEVLIVYNIFSEYCQCYMHLQAFSYDPSEKKVNGQLCSEELNEEQIKYIFHQIEPSDVLPVSIPLSTFLDLTMFINFVLFHYVQVKSEDENGQGTGSGSNDSFKFMIKPQPRSLLEAIDVEFMGIKHKLMVIHLNNRTIRIILKPILTTSINDLAHKAVDSKQIPNQNGEPTTPGGTKPPKIKNTIKLDVQMTPTMTKKHFELLKDNECSNLISEIIKGDQQQRKELSSKFERISDMKRTLGSINYYLKQANKEEFTYMIKDFLGHFEKFLSYYKLSVEDVFAIERYCMLKVINHKKGHFTIYEAIDHKKSPTFIIKARNTFSSFCDVEKGKKIHEEAFYYPTKAEIKTIFGVDYHSQEIVHKRYIWQHYIKRASLHFHAKEPIRLLDMPDLFEVEDEEVASIQEQNVLFSNVGSKEKILMMSKIQSPTGKTFYLRQKKRGFVTPITFEFKFTQDELFGIKVSLYDPSKSDSLNAVQTHFLICLNPIEVDIDNPKKKIKDKFIHLNFVQFRERYKLIEVFEKFGFNILKKNMIVLEKGDFKIMKKILNSEESLSLPLSDFSSLEECFEKGVFGMISQQLK